MAHASVRVSWRDLGRALLLATHALEGLKRMIVAPSPSVDEAVAVAVAVQAVLDGERGRRSADPLPAAYRSVWHRTALAESVGLTLDHSRRPRVS